MDFRLWHEADLVRRKLPQSRDGCQCYLATPRRLRDAHLKPNVRVSVPNTFYEVSISIPKG